MSGMVEEGGAGGGREYYVHEGGIRSGNEEIKV